MGKRWVFIAFGLALFAQSSYADVRVFACEPEWASLTSEIGGDAVKVFSATHGRQDPHFIRAKPSLIAQIRRADLLFCAGAELEIGWLPVLMQRGATTAVQVGQPGNVMAADYVTVLDKPDVVDRSLGDIHPSGNPHIHLDPRNIEILAGVVAERLIQIDPTNQNLYRTNLSSFKERWSKSMADWQQRATELAKMPVVVYHANWRYLFEWTGINKVATMERVPGIPPSASHLEKLLGAIEESKVEVILRAPHEPSNASEWLSERTDIPVLDLPYTIGGFDEVTDLFELFETTISLLEGSRS